MWYEPSQVILSANKTSPAPFQLVPKTWHDDRWKSRSRGALQPSPIGTMRPRAGSKSRQRKKDITFANGVIDVHHPERMSMNHWSTAAYYMAPWSGAGSQRNASGR